MGCGREQHGAGCGWCHKGTTGVGVIWCKTIVAHFVLTTKFFYYFIMIGVKYLNLNPDLLIEALQKSYIYIM